MAAAGLVVVSRARIITHSVAVLLVVVAAISAPALQSKKQVHEVINKNAVVVVVESQTTTEHTVEDVIRGIMAERIEEGALMKRTKQLRCTRRVYMYRVMRTAQVVNPRVVSYPPQ